MSADNWTVCPNCVVEHKKKRDAAIAKAAKAYGKIPVADWQAMDKEAHAMPEQPDETLREDYGLGVGADGEFYVSYSCSCSLCGWSFSYKDKRNALEPKP